MNWSRRSSDDSAPLRRVIFFTVIVIGVGLIDMGLGGSLRAFARDALTPFGDSVTRAWSQVARYTTFADRMELIDQLENANRELATLRERDALFESLVRENLELRELAAVAGTADTVSAPIASSFRASPYGTFVIAAGWQSGIEAGALVLSPEGYLLGTVTDVGLRTAIVRFVFAPEARVEAVADIHAFTLVGQGLTSAVARVPVETELPLGTTVYIPALNSLPAGIVTHIASTTASVYADVSVTLPVSLNAMRHVLVVPRDLPPGSTL